MTYRDILKNKEKQLRGEIQEAKDTAEVKQLGETLKAILEELKEIDECYDNTKKEKEKEPEPEEDSERSFLGSQNYFTNSKIMGSFGQNSSFKNAKNIEYREAFKEYIMSGKIIPKELRDSSLTTDVSSVIPVELVNKIIEKMDNTGMILPEITKTSYAAGITVPTSTTKPIATWVNEGASSDKQKKATASITFTYHKIRCEVSVSMEVSTMALSAFEAKFVENVSQAMIKAIEEAIINGDGKNKPKGILQENAPQNQTIKIVNGELTYEKLCEIEAAIPVEYEATAKYCMSKPTFLKWQSMTDKTGQPIARINYGINGKPERTLLGREVIIAPYVENLEPTKTNTFMFAFDFSDYILNTIYDLGISKQQDWETEDLRTKAVMSVDGKAVSVESLVKVTNDKK